jgi:hypothetical protein
MTAISTDIQVGADALGELSASFKGQLVRPGDPAYDEHRKVWNGSIDRFPALIARCSGVADVIAAVRFAAGAGLRVAVRSGGHSYPGLSVCDGDIVIDLGSMKGIRVDPKAHGEGPGRRPLGRARPRDPGFRARDHRRDRHPYRRRRPDARRRPRLASAKARADDRPAPLRRPGHRRGRARQGAPH